MRNNNKRNYKGNSKRTKSTVQGKGFVEDTESKSNSSDTEYNHNPASGKAFNDPDWYVNSEQILKDAARLPYSIPVGTCFKREGTLDLSQDPSYDYPDYDDAMPGIMVSYLMPTLGSTDQGNGSAVNIASNSLFQNVRAHISGSRKYEAVDMMIYMGAMDSIYCYVTALTRLYATVFTYHQANKYLSRALVEAQNVDYDDLVDHLPQFRAAVNIELAKIQAMYLPSVLPIFKRHSWMFSHYFIEGESEKDQIYFHSIAGVHRFTLDNDGKGALEALNLCMSDTKLTTAYLLQVLRSLIEPIYEREDFNTISGDLFKTYEGKVFTLTEIPDIATINLAYSEEVLLQFKNAKYKVIPRTGDANQYTWRGGFFNYYQNGTHHLTMVGTTVKSPLYWYIMANNNNNEIHEWSVDTEATKVMRAVGHELSRPLLITSPHHDVQPVENMINTRLTLAFELEYSGDTGWNADFTACYFGSEWPVMYKLFAYHRNKSTGTITLFSRMYDTVLRVNKLYTASWATSQEPVRSAFKYLPEIFLLTETDNQLVYLPGRSVFEVDNYALVDAQTIAGLHNAAILGEYNIPNLSVGK